MKKNVIVAILMASLFSGCANEFNRIYQSTDVTYKYECAKSYFAMGKFDHAATLLQDVVLTQKGRNSGQESLYMLAMALYNNRDFEAASATFKKYFQSLKSGGYLFIGSTEQILNYKEIGYERKNSFFYEKP